MTYFFLKICQLILLAHIHNGNGYRLTLFFANLHFAQYLPIKLFDYLLLIRPLLYKYGYKYVRLRAPIIGAALEIKKFC